MYVHKNRVKLRQVIIVLSHFSKIKYLKHMYLWRPSATLLGEVDMHAHWRLYMKFHSEQSLFEQFFDIIGNLVAFSPKVHLLSHFSTIKYLKQKSIFGGPQLHSWRRWTYAPIDFLVWNFILNNFYLNSLSGTCLQIKNQYKMTPNIIE